MSQPSVRDRAEALTRFTKQEARRLGFQLVGITTPDTPPHTEIYEQWLDKGQHGSMGYLATERAKQVRTDPTLLLPGCKSILVLGANYLPEGQPASSIAAYAVGDDYHEVLVDRLKQLISRLEEHVGREIKNRYYTDTGPILERELAQRAGLGWIGKNTCLINPQHGSYFFLAEVLLDLELRIDEPIKTDHCGECVLCIEACPTQCILPDRTLDARRCISYLTIELRESIPIALREQTGAWIFGCDICQQVCPWNLRFARPTGDPAFQPRPFLESPVPMNFLQLSMGDYKSVLRKSPLKRAKYSGLLRNAALAAANSGDRSSVPELVRLLREAEDPTVREHAAWSLGQLGEVRALKNALSSEKDPFVAEGIARAIEHSGS